MTNTDNANGQPFAPLTGSEDALRECVELLEAFVIDVLPQCGKLCIQDIAGLNRGLILAENLRSAGKLSPPNETKISHRWRERA